MSASPVATRRGMTLDDLTRFRIATEPRLSPDARWIAFTLQRMARDKDTYYSNLWLVPADGSRPARAFTSGDVKDRGAQWSPDGTRLAFVSNRDGGSHIYVIRVDGGEAQRLTESKGDVDALAWSPDGARLAFTFRAEDTPLPADPGGPEPKDDAPPRYRHVTRLHYKEDGVGFVPREWQHVWVVDVDDTRATGEPRQLTFGDADDKEPVWSPDGAALYFLSNRREFADWDEGRVDLYRVPAEGGDIAQVTPLDGPKTAVAVAADGASCVLIGHDDPIDGWGTKNVHVWSVDLRDGRARDLMPGVDLCCVDYLLTDVRPAGAQRVRYSADGTRLYVVAGERGAGRIYEMPVGGGAPRAITADKQDVGDFSLAGVRLAFVRATTQSPGEVCAFDIPTGETRVLTQLNAWIDDEIELAEVEELEVAGDGGPIQVWRVRPPRCAGVPDGTALPAVLHIHGGPHTMYGFTLVHEFQMLAARGFVVAWCNPRGSLGYGEAWTSAIKGDWGNKDAADFLAVADAMASWPHVDAARIGVGGGSYGGYMTNWLIGHTTRFKAAVTMRSVTNLHSFFMNSDFGYGSASYWGVPAWERPDIYLAQSPITYVTNVETPLLILHAENDFRCPIDQAEQLYTALRYMKKTVEFVRYPVESHGQTRGGTPSRRLDHQRRTRDWFERFLGPMTAAAAE